MTSEVAVYEPQLEAPDDDALIAGADDAHLRASRAQLDLLSAIAAVDRREGWRGAGARDTAHWVSMRYGVSSWKAHRWVATAQALATLPQVARALAGGVLGIDKVIELTRLATPETEAGLVRWATSVSAGAIRRRADIAARRGLDETREIEHGRYLRWWYTDDGKRLALDAELPADRGAAVVRAIQRTTELVPVMPNEEGGAFDEARRADALVVLCEGRGVGDGARDGVDATGRAETMIVVHASFETLAGGEGGAEIERGPVIPAATARRLACNARLQVLLEDAQGNPFALGRATREPSVPMLRQLRHRDRECRFPGCGARRFTQAHHIVWWSRGGRTDLDNLVLICSFHHRLVHEHGWGLTRAPDGELRWFDPTGQRYRAGPALPAAGATYLLTS